ncbi:C-terminal processing peptidase-3. Serine peptidase. MEROPS family S41A [Tissierella praeacuta DSM 18095]|uniref:C-terminal processing peptidase-3. Serine peptidase. MEROPS family S41A n=1 Tax=Tissierella praeacuta DSM 18095 TaxID=1123404 RepID=A0A1M4V6Q5_9FIRM|nr:S41 family peptidase [Tissierella praeacuta]TCU74102.1 carboxyl-terminal processing protease [Tissierella praeacuta]SHE64577.1 C-terminal processing peptidase-3. Serine peptidase. MEROPS family S41A [Tissierella praeacuta DSM 18095]SUP02951.1 Carboxy-terminal processing protease CtpB precursor [Tissierella praeacuta]
MSKKKVIRLMVVLLVVTNIITFGLTNLMSVTFSNKAYIPLAEYNKLKSVFNEFSKVMMVEDYVKENYLRDVDEKKLIDGQLKGMLQSLEDPYSTYMTKEEFESFLQQTSGTYAGIGVVVTPGDDNLITVVSPIEDTPGERAGIKSGDKIIKVNGVEYFGENMDEAVKVMKGDPNTKVSLTILRKNRENKNNIFDIEVTREIIRLVTVKSNIIDDDIGYIKITSFDELTYKDFKIELDKLGKRNIKGLIIDLRNNPGGLLNVCADIADELLGEGDIVYTQTKDGKREYLKSDKKMVDYPLVLLVNKGSASASEILAGAVKDHKRGTLIGTTTFGKGVVQRIKDLDDGSGLRLTISEYFTPNGINIHGIGIEPDIVVELTDGVEEIGVNNLKEDNQLRKALEEIKTKIK